MAILNCIDENSAEELAIAIRRHTTNTRYVEVCKYQTKDGATCYYVAAQMKPER